MKSLSKILRGSCAIVTSGALVLSTFPAVAQDQPPPGAQLPPPGAAQQPPQPAAPQLGQAELEKLVAPIALYPDDLVAQILTASTYPIEVVQASRWVSAHPNVHGNALQDAMQQEQWDPSVKGLTAVPQVLAMMNDKLDWTQQLGEAFLAQPNDVSNAVQQLRAKAQANGNLKSSDRIRVRRVAPPEPPPVPIPVDVDSALLPPPPPPEYIVIEPVDPGVYYVPIYDPYVVYGPWVWPAYRPFYWYPPGYVVGAAVIGFGVGFVVGSALWCHYNWGGGYGYGGGGWHGPVTINVVQYNQFNRTNIVAERNGTSNWQFDAAASWRPEEFPESTRNTRHLPGHVARQPARDTARHPARHARSAPRQLAGQRPRQRSRQHATRQSVARRYGTAEHEVKHERERQHQRERQYQCAWQTQC